MVGIDVVVGGLEVVMELLEVVNNGGVVVNGVVFSACMVGGVMFSEVVVNVVVVGEVLVGGVLEVVLGKLEVVNNGRVWFGGVCVGGVVVC